MPFNSKGILLLDSVADDNPVIATDQSSDFPVEWAFDDDTSHWWKATGPGTADLIIDAQASDDVNALGMGVHNLKTAAATIELLKSSGLALSDAFDDSSFDTANFGSDVAGALVPWALASSVYDNVSFLVSPPELGPHSMTFKPDGTKMYIVGETTDTVYEFTLSTPWDQSTAVQTASFPVSEDGTPSGIRFKPDGTKMYISGRSNDKIYQYSLSTAWDVSTGSYDSKSLDVSGETLTNQELHFRSDGKKVYVLGGDGIGTKYVYQYSLSTAWDASTGSYDTVSFSVNPQESNAQGMSFKPDGSKMYIVGASNNTVYQYSLSTPWDLSTTAYDTVLFPIAEEGNPSAVAFKPDGTKMYIMGFAQKTVFRYSMTSTGTTGSVTETTELAVVSTAFGEAAMVYDKNTLKGRSIPYDIQHTFDTTPSSGLNYKMLCLGLWQDSSAPAIQTGVKAADDLLTAMLYARTVGSDLLFYIAYRTTAGTWKYWTGSTWSDTETSFYTGVAATQYIAKIINDGTGPDFQLWNAGDTVEHGSAQPLWDSIDDTLDPEYAVWGDPSTDEVITESELQPFKSDAFDDSSLDAALWGTSVSGAGSVVETTSLVATTLADADAALTYYKHVLNARAEQPWKLRHTVKALDFGAGAEMKLMMLWQGAAPPAAAGEAAFDATGIADIYQDSSGDLFFRYWDAVGTAQYWDGDAVTPAWVSTPIRASAAVTDTVYIAEMFSDLTKLYFRIYNSAGTLIVSAEILWASVRAEANSLYALWGDPYTDAEYGQTVSTLFEHLAEGYRGTINSQLYEHSGEGGTYTQVEAPFTPDNDLAFIKQITPDSSRYWKIQIVTASVTPFIGYTRLGEILSLERYLQDGYDPQRMKYKYTTGVTEGGNFLPVNVAPPMIPLSVKLANLTDSWIEGTLRPAMDAHIGIGRPFLFAWDITNHPKQTFICRLKPQAVWTSPYSGSRRNTSLELEALFNK